MGVNEAYSEESFKKQIAEGGHVSFKNLPCPVHGSCMSSISLTGFFMSAVCCNEQVKWVGLEIERLGLGPVVKNFRLQADIRRQAAIKLAEDEKKRFEILGTELVGSKVIACNEPDSDGFASIVLEASGKRYRIYGREDGVGVDQV